MAVPRPAATPRADISASDVKCSSVTSCACCVALLKPLLLTTSRLIVASLNVLVLTRTILLMVAVCVHRVTVLIPLEHSLAAGIGRGRPDLQGWGETPKPHSLL